MRLPRFFGKQSKPKLVVRRIVGNSMLPTFRPGQLVVATTPVRSVSVGDVVVVRHGGLEKIKRVARLRTDNELYLLGDNPLESSDSRSFGWLSASQVRAKVIWPRKVSRRI